MNNNNYSYMIYPCTTCDGKNNKCHYCFCIGIEPSPTSLSEQAAKNEMSEAWQVLLDAGVCPCTEKMSLADGVRAAIAQPSAEPMIPVGTLAVYDDKDATFGYAYDISTNKAGHEALQKLDGTTLYASKSAQPSAEPALAAPKFNEQIFRTMAATWAHGFKDSGADDVAAMERKENYWRSIMDYVTGAPPSPSVAAETIREAALEEAVKACEDELIEQIPHSTLPEGDQAYNRAITHCVQAIRALAAQPTAAAPADMSAAAKEGGEQP